MSLVDRDIHGQGRANAAQLRESLARRGRNLAAQYAPDHQYHDPPADIGHIIIEEAHGTYGEAFALDADGVTVQINEETAGLQSAFWLERNNPGGIGAVDSNPNAALRFPSQRAGIHAHCCKLRNYRFGEGPWSYDDPRFEAVRAAGYLGIARTWRALQGRWATSPTYAQSLESIWTRLEQIMAESPPVPTQKHIALAAGHRNISGGNDHEREQTAILTPAIAAACRAAGFDVRVVQSNDGAGMFPGKLDPMTQTVVDWHNGGWTVDLFCEVHTEGNGAGDAGRGGFVVYPFWPEANDDDQDARIIGRAIADCWRDELGLPLRRDGSLPETQTRVGARGDRLGVFRVTAPIKATCTRMILEVGAHTSPLDLAIVDNPANLGIIADCVAEQFARFYGVAPIAEPDALIVNGVPIVRGFKAFWLSLPSDTVRYQMLGLPLAPERPVVGVEGVASMQLFERAILQYTPGERPDWQISVAPRAVQRQLEAL